MNNVRFFLLNFLVLAFVLVSKPAIAQEDVAIGFRFGDPSGITLKKFFDDKAFELNVGRSHFLQRNSKYKYNDRFNEWYQNSNYNFNNLHYEGYRRGIPLGIQFHYLVHAPLGSEETSNGLKWYYGIGAQARFQSFSFDYRYKVDGQYVYERSNRVYDYDLGVDGILGLEYKFPKTPLSIFLDGTLFMEVIDDPFLFWLQGGFGIRYHL